MKLFISTAYSKHINEQTGDVFAEYKLWLESFLLGLEASGHSVFCALREDNYHSNALDLAAAFKLDIERLADADALLALVGEAISAGVQTEIGIAVASHKKIVLAHEKIQPLNYINQALLKAGYARELLLPYEQTQLAVVLV